MATEAATAAPVEEQTVEQEQQEQQEKPRPKGPRPEEPAEEVDFSLLVMVKGRAKRPQRPDDSERNLMVGKLQEQIDKATARIAEIKGILDARGSSRGVVSPEVQAGRDKIAQLRAEFDTVLLQKKRLNSQNDDRKTERDKLYAEFRQLKDTIRGPANLASIEEAIARMEHELTHESMSAEREKALRDKKERAEKNDRPAAMRLAQLSAKIDEAKAASEAIRADIAVLNKRLDSIKAAREVEEGKLQDIRAAQQEARSDIPALNVEKKELWEVISALRDKQREIRVSFQAQWDDFKKADRAWKAWYAEERKKRNEQRHQEYLERQAARDARDKEHKPAKFEHEVYTCEQVLSYLRQFVPAEAAAAPAAKAADKKQPAAVDAPGPGMKLLSRKKGDEVADAMFSGSGAKKGRGARKAAEKQKVAEAVKLLPRVLPLETLKTFHELGVDPPSTNEEVPKTIAKLEAKKKEYEDKRDKAAAEPPSEEEEPAAEEPADKAADKEEEAKAADKEGKEEGEPAPAAKEPAAAGKEEAKEEEAKEEQEGKKEEDAPAEANGGEAAAASSPTPKAEDADLEVRVSPKKAPAGGSPTKGAGKAAAEAEGDVGVKLRVTDDGEVNVEVNA